MCPLRCESCWGLTWEMSRCRLGCGGMDARQLRHLHPGDAAILLQRRCLWPVCVSACMLACSLAQVSRSISLFAIWHPNYFSHLCKTPKHQTTVCAQYPAPGLQDVCSAWAVSFGSCWQAPQSRGHQKLSFAVSALKIQLFA